MVLEIINPQDRQVETVIQEQFSRGWTAQLSHPPATIASASLTWNALLPPGASYIRYTLVPPAGSAGAARFSGTVGSTAILGAGRVRMPDAFSFNPERFTGVVILMLLLFHAGLCIFASRRRENIYFTWFLAGCTGRMVFPWFMESGSRFYQEEIITLNAFTLLFLAAFFYSLLSARLPKTFWGMLVVTDVFLIVQWVEPYSFLPMLFVPIGLWIGVECAKVLVRGMLRRHAGWFLLCLGGLQLAGVQIAAALAFFNVIPGWVAIRWWTPISLLVFILSLSVYLLLHVTPWQLEMEKSILQEKQEEETAPPEAAKTELQDAAFK